MVWVTQASNVTTPCILKRQEPNQNGIFFVHSSFLFKFLFLLFDAYPSYALIYGMLGVIFLVKLSVWFKKKINKLCSHSWDARHYFFSQYGLKRKKKQRKGWRGSNPGHKHNWHRPFHYTTIMFATICQVLSF